MNDDANENNLAGNHTINTNKTRRSKSFEIKTKIIKRAPANNNRLNTEVIVPLKYSYNLERYLDLPLINCEIELDLP